MISKEKFFQNLARGGQIDRYRFGLSRKWKNRLVWAAVGGWIVQILNWWR